MDETSSSVVGAPTVIRKSPCRYGRGCTHINDPSHLERFRHPLKQDLNAEEIRRNYMCNECGMGFDSLAELRFHLQKKTAWSNESLVGCRISCLVDCKEWHEGLVTHYHRSGKHCVEFRAVSEKRWFHMLKLAFHIVEPLAEHETNEFKDNESELSEFNANEQKSWTYYEDISFDYAFTQSVLFKIYGGVVQETGHKTRGHVSLTEYDRYVARSQKGSLLYGELLPRGVNKALDPYHLDACKAQVLFDMGMGTGKVAIQAFLQFRNLVYVYGVELSVGRYLIAEAAALRMVQLLGEESFNVDVIHGEQITITELVANNTEKGRVLRLQCGNMMDVKDINIADIIMMETDLPAHLQFDLCLLLQQEMHENSRILSYHDLFKIWPLPSFPFKQLDINCSLADRFPTSWSVQRGHHFFLFKKYNRQNSKNSFQRHLQRTIGRSSSANNNSNENRNGDGASSGKSPTWSATATRQAPFESATPPKPSQVSTSKDGANNLSEKEYRESQTYGTTLPNEPHLQETAIYRQQSREIPRLNGRHSRQTVEIVDESSCGCNVFSSIFSGIFSSQHKPKKEFASTQRQDRPSNHPEPHQRYNNVNTSAPSSSSMPTSALSSTATISTAVLVSKDVSADAWTPKKVKELSPRLQHSSPTQSPRPTSPPISSPAAQIIRITSNSPRSVLVEQNKSPRRQEERSS